ncbi:protein AHNAK2 isoform X4 [Rattus norvegicus]|uniref:protein AHNAK2 isoform X4 n=1 Tax=Rattus norvegicus TaxID=10116 RepID=UPI002FD826C2
MCDCFHVVLPTWPGAPGSVSGRQLQQQEPEAETEDDYSVTEGPVGEVVRPRPQGSSPVYEYTAEGAGFGGQETGQGRHSSSGRRRSWWRRDSGESTAFASMSHPGSVQESTEVTLKTDVESGASGYSVTGGGDQGIFVKQVLKDSSAAKLFNLREGDQLLSATIFFDHMKYEDALKILQYSEPYKVQFKIKRKLSANEGEEGAVQHPQQGQKGKEKQDIADGCTETPTKSVDGAGDRERLISKSRDDRHRRPQDRFSWPKFQALRSKRRAGPRRSHSSSEASEHRDTRDLSPTSTDTELQLTTDREDQSSGAGRQRRRFLNLRIGMTSGQSPVTTEQKDSKPQDRREQAAVLGEGKSKEDERKDTQGAEEGQTKDKKQKTGFMSTTRQKTTRDNYSNLEKEADGKKEFKTERHQKKKKQVKKEKKDEKLVQITKEIPQELQWEDSWEEVQSLEIGIARLSLKDTQEQHLDAEIQGGDGKQDKDMASKDTKFKMPKFKMPSFSVSAPGKPTVDTSLEVGAPKVEGDMALPYVQGDLKPTDVSIQLPSANLELKAGKEGVKQPEDQSTDAETPTQAAAGAGLKGHLPKVQMPSLKMPKVDVKGPHVDLKAPKVDVTGVKGEVRSPDLEVTLPGVEVDIQAPAAKVEGDKALGDKDLATKDSKFKMPKFKMPSFGVSVPGKPTVDASLHVGTPKVEGEVALPSVEGDLKTPDISIQLPSAHLELRPRQEGVKLAEDQPTDAETSVQAAAGTSLKGHLPKVQMPSLKMPKVDLKGPHVDVKGPKVDEKGPKVDVKGAKGKVRAPDLDVALPGVEVDIEAPCAKLEGDVLLGDQDVAAKDSRFKMPKFKMPSFSVSASGKPSVEASLEVGAPKVEGDVALPSVQGDLKTPDVSIQLPSTDLEIRAGQEGVNLMKDHPPDVETHARAAAGGGLKGHMPKVHMPSIKMPKVELKGPHVDMKGPKLEVKGAEGEVSGPELEVSLPGVEVDIQAPSVNLEGDVVLAEKDLAAKDTKFKMPKFKMPSFGVSIPGKPTMEASLEVGAPKVEGDVALPSGKGDLKTPDVSIQLPSAHLDLRAGQVGVKLAEDQPTDAETSVQAAAGVSLKGHLPKVQMPSLKMPKVDVKGPHVDLKDPKVDVTGVKGEVRSPDLEVTLPGVEVDIQAPAAKVEGDKALGDKDLATKDSKFKMPKFKMPSFRVSAHGKPTVEASLEVGAPKVEGDVVLPSVQGDKKTPDVSIQLPSAHLDLRAGQVGLKLAEDQPTDAETSAQAAAGASLKGHLPKVQMPSLKMPKVDVKGPHVDLKVPKVDMTGDKGEVRSPELEVALPGVEVDIQGPAAKVGGDMALGEKEVATKDSKFKMPKFKMPSFGVSVPGKPTVDASLRVGAPKVEGEVVLPSVQGDLKTPDVSMQLPSADLELRPRQEGEKLSEDLPRDAETSAQAAAGASLKGHLPKVQMPSLKVPKVDLKGPHVDVKGPKVDVKDPKVDVKGAKGEVRAPDLDVALPGVEVDIQAPCAKLEGDVLLGDQDVAGKDTKFKMPKFKMPSFSVSASGKPSVEASLEVGAPKVEGDVALPSVQGDLKTPDVSIQLPSTDLEIRAGQVGVNLMKDQPPDVETHARAAAGGGLKGHMPKVHMPSIKMPKVELKGPHVDMKGPKLEVKGAEGEVSGPELEVSLPGVEVDIQAPSVNLEGDVVLAEKDLAAKDTKFKMPKFKMPSFGVSIPGKPTMEASLEVGAPKVEGDVALPSGKGDLKTPDVSIQLPSAHLDLRAGQVGVKLAEDQPTDAETSVQAAAGVSLKGHLPKVQMPSLKMPKVDVKGPHVDLKDPKVDVTGVKGEVRSPDLEVTLPGVEVDIQAPAAKVEGDKALGDKDLATKDSKFKMPKFKMPSFRVSAHGKPTVEASLEVGAPKVEGDVVLPSVQGDKKTPDVSIQLPSAHLDLRAGQVGLKLAEDQPTDAETSAQAAAGASLKGHLPKVQMPSLKMPKVDVKGPHVDLKVPKVDMTGDKGEVRSPELEVALPGVEVDIQGPAAKVGGDMALGEKEVATKDSKFKMPKFKMPSFGVSVPGKPTVDASLRVGAPKVEGEVVLPSVQGDLKTPDVSMQLPSADLELRPRQEGEKLSEDLPRDAETSAQAAAGASLKGHLPKVQMPSLKVPKVDLKGPHVDVKGPKVDVKDPKVDVKGAKGEVRAPDLDVALPGVEVDIQAPCAKLEGDVLLGDQDVAGKDTKFKMPKFKMPSFSVSASGKPSVEASLEVGAPKVEGDVALPSVQGDLKTPDVSIQLPSTDLEIRAGQVGVNLMKDQPPDVETHARAAAGGGLKGHMPKVHMPSIKMPKVELKGPHVDMKGPKLEVKGAEGEVSGPELEVSLPGVEVDIQAPSVNLEGDVVLAEKDLAAKDTKFKMPKFKMPSFGLSAPGKPTVEASLELVAPKVERDVVLPSVKGDLKTPDVSIQLPSAHLDLRAGQVGVKLAEDQPTDAETSAQAAAGASLKGHLPKVQMPSLKMPKVDVKGPHVDLKVPKVDMTGDKGEVRSPDLEVALPGVEVDIQGPAAKVGGDMALGEKEVATKDSKFKMPKFKMPSFGVSVPGKPTVDASLRVGAPKVEGEVVLPSVQGDLKTPDVSMQLPSADLELRASQEGQKLSEDLPSDAETSAQAAAGASLKGHLPKVQMPSLKVPKVDLKGPHVDVKGPKVDVKAAKDEVRAPDLDVTLPSVEVDIQAPCAKLEGVILLGDQDVAAKDTKFKMPKFKMPSFGVSAPGKPTVEASLEVGAPKVEGDVALPSVKGDLKTTDASIQLPSAHLDLRPGQVGVKLSEDQPTDAETSAQAAAGASLKGHLPKVQMPSLKMPKVDVKGPHVDLKVPKVDMTGDKGEVRSPELEVALPGVEVDIQGPAAKVGGDMALGEKEVATKDSKFKMPKFKMPSFGVSVPGKPTVDASLRVGAPKVEGEVVLPSVQGDLKTPDVSMQLPSADLELRPRQEGEKLSEDLPRDAETSAQAAAGASLKGHLPKVQMPSLKVPKVDLKGPHVDVKGPKVDVKDPKVDVKGAKGEVRAPDLDVALPGVEVDIQAPCAKLEGDVLLGDQDVAGKDTKFKMPKFKMPSFSVSASGKPSVEASLEVGAPKVEGDVALPSVQGDLKTPDVSIQLPSTDLEIRAGQVGVNLMKDQPPDVETHARAAAGGGLKGHMPKVHMPSIKMPKVELKGPHVDMKGPKLEVKGAEGEVSGPELEVSLPGVEVDIQAPSVNLEGDVVLAEKDLAAKDTKFKMPKFKMPSFGVSTPGKPTVEASLKMGAPKVEGDVVLPSVKGDLKTPDVSIQLPSAHLDLRAGQVGVKLAEDQPTDAETSAQAAAGASLKGHLPKVQMPSLKMPKVDVKGPHVDLKVPKVDMTGDKGEVRSPDLEVALPGVEVDIQGPAAKVGGDMALGEKEVATKDSKFKMPKFKMPSFGVSVPGKPTVDASLRVGAPKVEGEVVLPSVQGDLKTPDVSMQLPSADLELRASQEGQKLSEDVPSDAETSAQAAAGASLKGHLPKVQMPSLKVPKVDLKGPHVDVKGPKVDVKAAKDEVRAPDLDVTLPSVEVDIQAPCAKLEGVILLGDQDVAAKDTKFKMPKFKMPSFGVSAPGKPTVEASLEVGAPKVEGDVALPSVKGDLKTTDASIQLPSAHLDLRPGQVGVKLSEDQPTDAETSVQAAAGVSLKGQLPKVQMPSLKMPKEDVKGPYVDLKAPKVDVTGDKGEVRSPDLEVTLPGEEVDIQAPGVKLEGDVVLAEKDLAAKDTKFKMPKFKMPSFGVSTPGKPTVEASLKMGAPKVEGDVVLPSVKGDLKTPDVSIQLPSAHLDLRAGQVGVKLAEDQPTDAETSAQAAAGASLKGHLPKVQMPSLKMPKVDVKGPHVDLKDPKVDVTGVKGEVRSPDLEVTLPGVEVDIQAPAAKVEGDKALGDKDLATKDSKFKMPKFKMPSFGVSAHGKPTVEASLEVGAPKVEGDVVLPSVQGDLKTPDVSIQLPSAHLDLRAGQVGLKLAEDQPTDAETSAQAAAGASLKGHLPKVQMPSLKMPKVDVKGPHVDLKVPKVDMTGDKGEVRSPDLEVALPGVEVDIQGPAAKVGGDMAVGEKEVATKDSKFKMPKFKMPSFGVSVPGKPTVDASLRVGAPKGEGEVVLPSVQGDLKTPDVSMQLPSADLELRASQEGVKLSEDLPSDAETSAQAAAGASLKGHLPKVQMPSLKVPKVDLKGPHVDVKGPKVDVKGPKVDMKGDKGEVRAPDLDVALPCVEVDIQAPCAKLEGDVLLGDQDVAAKDTKFKMPKFKMPSFGVSMPGKPTVESSLEVGPPKVEGDVALPSVQGDLKTPDVSIQLPSTDLEIRAGQVGVKLPDVETPAKAAVGGGLKGHLPEVQMPSLKMPKVELKGPHVDVKGPTLEVKGSQGEVSAPEFEVSLPGMEMDIQAPSVNLEGDVVLAEKDLAAKDTKFKMPKFKMPSFGVSMPGKPTVESSLEVWPPKVDGNGGLPSVQGDLKTPDVSIQLPSTNLEIRAGQVGATLTEGQPPDVEMPAKAAVGGGLKGHLPEVQMPSLTMPKVEIKGPHVDMKGPKLEVKGSQGEVSAPEFEVSVPDLEVDMQATGVKLEGDVALAEKDLAPKDTKFKMPKFKMPSFGVSASGKPTVEASLELGAPKVEGEVALPSMKGDLKTPDVSIQLPSAQVDLRVDHVGVKLAEDQPTNAETSVQAAAGVSLKGHLPKVQMPSLKMPKVDVKGPHVDLKAPHVDMTGVKGEVRSPDLEVTLPGVEVDIQVTTARLGGDMALGEKEVAAKDSKFKMPSFSVSVPRKPTVDASLELGDPKVEGDVVLPSVQGDLKTPDVSIQLPTADLELRARQEGMMLAQDQPTDAETPAQDAAGASLKAHLPKVRMPSLKMPKVDLKGPHVDVKGPKVDVKGAKGEVRAPDLDVALPCVEVEIQAPCAKLEGDVMLGDQDVAGKDSKFKMPKIKMPSFSVSMPGKPTVESSLELGAPKVEGDVALPSVQGDLKTPDVSIQLPSTDLEIRAGQVGLKLPQDQPTNVETSAQAAAGGSLKGHLPKVQMPSLKMPKVDLKGPHVDVKGPKVDVKGSKGEVRAPDLDVAVPNVEVDIQPPCAKLEGDIVLGDQDVAAKDTKFKMPKFKMPSFGVSLPGKPIMEASLEVGAPKVEGDLALPSVQGDLKTPDVSIQLPSAHLDLRARQEGVKLAEDQPTDEEAPAQAAAGASLKGHLPKVQMPSLKIPKVDVKGPHVDVKGPKVDVKAAKDKVRAPDLDVTLPGVEVDIEAPCAKLEGDVLLGDQDVAAKDTKFKMPKFKMPSFGVSVPGKPTVEASLEVGAPKVEGDVALPSVQGDLKTPDVSIQLLSAHLDLRAGQVGLKLAEDQSTDAETSAQAAAGVSLKGQLPKVQMPSLKMPKVDVKGPHVDLKVPKVDVTGVKGEVRSPELEVALPGVEVDIQGPAAKVGGDMALGEKEVATKDSKFKMPKFKMPSFSVSVPGKPTVDASLRVGAPKVEGEVVLPSVQGDLKTPDVSMQLPSADLELRASQEGVKLSEDLPSDAETSAQAAAGASLKGHLPKVQMPSLNVPKVDLKGPHVDVKGPKVDVKDPKVDVKGAKGEVRAPDLDVALPRVEVDIQAPCAKLEGDVLLGDQDVAAKDTKFKMPKFKMPSFGVSMPGKPTVESSLEVEGDVALPSVQGDLKTPDVSIQLPSTDLEIRAGQMDVMVLEHQSSDVEMSAQAAADAGPKGHLPTVQIPRFKMSKVDVKGPHVEVKGPKVDVTGGNDEVGSSNREGFFHYPDDDVSHAVAAFPADGFPGAVVSPSPHTSQSFYSYVGRSSIMVDPPPGSLDSTLPQFSARILFPKFHKPKFVLSLPPSESECPPSVPEAGVHSPQASDTLSGSAAPQVPSSDASDVCILDVSSSQSLISPPPETSTLEMKDTSFKLPSIKLPSLHWSPKKTSGSKVESDSQESPLPSLGLSSAETDSEIQSEVSIVESPQHGSLDKEVDKGRGRKLSFSLPRLALPKVKVSKGSAAVPQGDLRPSLTGTTSGGDLDVIETAVSDAHFGDTHSKDVTTELHVRASSTTAELPTSETELPPPKDDLNVRGDGKSLKTVSPSQPFGELATPRTEGLPQPSGRQGDSAPTVEDLEMDPTAKEMSTDSKERRFRIPKFRVPGFRRSSSKDRDRAGEQEAPQKSQTPVIDMPSEAEETAAACMQLSHVPESKIETHISLGSPEEGTGVRPLERPTYAEVVKHDLHGTGSRMHHSTVELSRTHLPTPECGSQGSISLEVPGVRVSEPQLPPEGTGREQHPGPGGNILDEMEARTGHLASQPQGPLRLKASLTEVPSQVSVVSMSQLWEDSVLTVTFPKLKVPRFSFPAPSSEADVFFPVVREVEASIDSTVHKGSPGLWEASILKTGTEDTGMPPASPEQSSEASPISKVRVHIQGSRGESQEVAISSRVEGSSADPLVPGPLCTQIVRESEIPASTIQTPSYGFSLLKVKIPEPPMQACVYTVGPDSQEGEGGVPMPAAAGGHSIPAEVPPDTGEPFEIISSGTGMPPGPQLVDGTSDEEPAEILEFPEDSQEVKAPDTDTKQKAEGKKSSLLWSWLPSIGFSSVEETAADSRDTTQRSPVHVQPTARLDPELPRKQEKAGWFRFPKLGFSSSPTKKPRSTEDVEGQAEHKLQEETVTFFDARESFSPEEEEEAKSEVTSAGPGSEAMVTSSARTELVLLEQTRDTGDKSIPRPVAK